MTISPFSVPLREKPCSFGRAQDRPMASLCLLDESVKQDHPVLRIDVKENSSDSVAA
jgi:hypothetical protein